MHTLIRFDDPRINIYGRTRLEEGALSLSWSASGFEVKLRAERVFLRFMKDYAADQPCYIGLELDGEIDGGRMQKYAVTTGAEVAILEDIPEGEHVLRMYRLSAGDRLLKLESLELFGEDCDLCEPPKRPELRIEFIGDSITCGFGNIAEPDAGAYFTCHEDTTKTYASLTARALGAEMRAIAISGQGIVKNCNGDIGYRIPSFFEHELRVGNELHDFGSWIPQVVVVNAGTNDQGGRVDKEKFAREASAFLDSIRAHYPETLIFWVYGMMAIGYDETLREVIASKDERVHYLPIEPIWRRQNETGALGHPNVKGHERAAAELTAAIKRELSL